MRDAVIHPSPGDGTAPAAEPEADDLLSALARRAGVYVGRGVNHEREAFTGRLRVQPLVGGRAVLLGYTATRDDGVSVHEEATLLGRLASGALCLWPVMGELPMVLPHEAVPADSAVHDGHHARVFASGQRSELDTFREEISLILRPDGTLVYAHAWGLPGGEFGERSSCEMRLTGP